VIGSTAVAAVVALLGAQAGTPSATGTVQLTVEPGGRSIAETLAAAPRGARVVIRAGTYAEPTIIVERPVQIVGDGWPVLDGGGGPILVIRADSVRIAGLLFRNVRTSYVEDRAAIRVEDASDCVIEANRIETSFFGVYLARSQNCVIADNVIVGDALLESAAGNGIHLWYSRYNRIVRNRITGHRDGIYLEFVEDTEVDENISHANLRYGLHFMFSNRCTYHDNVFRRNAAGVAVMYSKEVHMERNLFEHNRGSAAYALLLKDITDSEVRDNRFTGNSVAMYAEGANRIMVDGNRFERNGIAIRIMANSQDSRFTGNTFIGNTFDVTTNSRASYSTFAGNYWDAYRGYDLDGDGVGDVPYRPVRLFSLLVEQNPPALLLLRSFIVTLLDGIERAVPAVTPETLMDETPLMRGPS
jgi:nitrous oxidase accessory protein